MQQDGNLFPRETKRLGDCQEIVGQIAPEVGRVVGVDSRDEASVEHPCEWMSVERWNDLQRDVREWTDRQRNALGGETIDEFCRFEAPNPVVDPLDPERVERAFDIAGGPLFSGVGNRVKPVGAASVEQRRERFGPVSPFGAVEPNPADGVVAFQDGAEGVLGPGTGRGAEESTRSAGW